MNHVQGSYKKKDTLIIAFILLVPFVILSCTRLHETGSINERMSATSYSSPAILSTDDTLIEDTATQKVTSTTHLTQPLVTPIQTESSEIHLNEYIPSWPTYELALVIVIDEIPVAYTVNSDGTGLKQIAEDVENSDYPDWSPDGNKIALISFSWSPFRTHLIVIDIESSQIVFQIDHIKEETWSPDGSQLAFTTSSDYITSYSGEIWLASEPDWAPRQIFKTSDNVGAMYWSPTSDQILVRLHDPESGAPKLNLLELDGTLEGLPIDGLDIDWDPTGHMIAYTDFDGLNSQIRVFNITNNEDRSLTSRGEYSAIALSWSPLGDQLAFRAYKGSSEAPSFRLLDVETNSTSVISTNNMKVSGFSWSPDGLFLGLMLKEGQGLYCSLNIYSLQERKLIEVTEALFDCHQIAWRP